MFCRMLKKTEQDEWGNGASVMAFTLQLEKNVNQTLLDLHQIASRYVDPHIYDFLETHDLEEEVRLIKRLEEHVTNLKHVCAYEDGLDEYLFDHFTLGESSDRAAECWLPPEPSCQLVLLCCSNLSCVDIFKKLAIQ